MIQSILTWIAALTTTVAASVTLLFVPAVIELKKPPDAGPRCIPDSSSQIRLNNLKMALSNIDEELKFESYLTSKIGSFLHFIPNLDA